MARVGRSDGMIARLLATSNEVVEARATGEHSFAGSVVQVEVELLDESTVFVDLVLGLAGGGGAMVRLPKVGETVLVAFAAGELARGFMLGFVASESTTTPDEIPADAYVLAAGGGEHVLVSSVDGRIELETGGGARLKLDGGDVELVAGDTKLELASSGGWRVSNAAGGYIESDATGFVDFGNNAGSVVEQIRAIGEGLTTGTVPTLLGPQLVLSPKFAIALTALAGIKAPG